MANIATSDSAVDDDGPLLTPKTKAFLFETAAAFVTGGFIGGKLGAFSSAGLYVGVRMFARVMVSENPVAELPLYLSVVVLPLSYVGASIVYGNIADPASVVRDNAAQVAINQVLDGKNPASSTMDVTAWSPFGSTGEKIEEITVTALQTGTSGACQIIRISSPGLAPYTVSVNRPDFNTPYQSCPQTQALDND